MPCCNGHNFLQQRKGRPLLRHRLLILNGVLLLALLGNHWGRQLESASVACPTFLQQLPLPFRNWSATDIALTRSEIEMLEPDAVLMRRYQSPDGRQVAELAVIAGHRKRSVHTPYVCMRGGGWEILSQHRVDLHI